MCCVCFYNVIFPFSIHIIQFSDNSFCVFTYTEINSIACFQFYTVSNADNRGQVGSTQHSDRSSGNQFDFHHVSNQINCSWLVFFLSSFISLDSGYSPAPLEGGTHARVNCLVETRKNRQVIGFYTIISVLWVGGFLYIHRYLDNATTLTMVLPNTGTKQSYKIVQRVNASLN